MKWLKKKFMEKDNGGRCLISTLAMLFLVEATLFTIAAMVLYHRLNLGIGSFIIAIISSVNYLLAIITIKKYFYMPNLTEDAKIFTAKHISRDERLNDCHPLIGPLLHEKMEKALPRGITLTLEVDGNFKKLTLHHLTITSLLGSLIDNVITITSSLKPEEKHIFVKVHEKAGSYIFSIVLPDTTRLTENVLSPKNSKQEYNQFLVKNIAAEYGGTVEILSNPASFKVTLPKGEKCA